MQALSAIAERLPCPTYAEGIPQTAINNGRYLVRFARTVEEIAAALKLRFEVFNLNSRKESLVIVPQRLRCK